MSLTKLVKRAATALLGIALLWTVPAAVPAMAAGTLPIAMAQQVDINGQPIAGCLVNFFVAGTPSAPQNSYSDFGLSQNPNSVLQCDQTGRVPMFWLADGLVHVRMTDASGVPIIDTTMQVLGPSSGGGGGGGTVDPTAILTTGDLKGRFGTGAISGFVRCNNLTIGNASSGATERANADTQSLFVYLYTVDSTLVVSGGRTGNALNDYNANKTIATPDWRGRAMAFMDDMGNSAAGRLTVAGFGASATVLGAVGGQEIWALTLAQIPAGIVSSVSVASAISQFLTAPATGFGIATFSSIGGGAQVWKAFDPGAALVPIAQIISTGSATSVNTSGGAHPTVMPTKLATLYVKL